MIVLPFPVIIDPLSMDSFWFIFSCIHGLLYMCLYPISLFPKRDCAFLHVSFFVAKRLLPFICLPSIELHQSLISLTSGCSSYVKPLRTLLFFRPGLFAERLCDLLAAFPSICCFSQEIYMQGFACSLEKGSPYFFGIFGLA